MGILINQGRQIGGLSEQDQANIGKVTQTETTTSADYELLFSETTADATTHTEEARKSSKIIFNPSNQTLKIKNQYDNQTIIKPNSINVDGDTTASMYSGSIVHGFGSKTESSHSYAGGYQTQAKGYASHAEGNGTVATGQGSHAEGYQTYSRGDYSHSEGTGAQARGHYSHAEGSGTIAGHATSTSSPTTGQYSHAEGQGTKASGTSAHAEGGGTTASGDYSHAEGGGTNASSQYSHAEGGGTTASGASSHAEGNNTTASGDYSHAEGNGNTASNYYAHAEGQGTKASGTSAHAEGGGTTASASGSHAEGGGTNASGVYSHAEGNYTKASSAYQHVEGKYNIEDTQGTYAHIIGNGTANNARSNAYALRWDGQQDVTNDIVRVDSGGTWDGANKSLEDSFKWNIGECSSYDADAVIYYDYYEIAEIEVNPGTAEDNYEHQDDISNPIIFEISQIVNSKIESIIEFTGYSVLELAFKFNTTTNETEVLQFLSSNSLDYYIQKDSNDSNIWHLYGHYRTVTNASPRIDNKSVLHRIYGSGVHDNITIIMQNVTSQTVTSRIIPTRNFVKLKDAKSFVRNSAIANNYDSTTTYEVGDLCFYQSTPYSNVLYICNTAISTPEDFNSSHWTATTVTDYCIKISGIKDHLKPINDGARLTTANQQGDYDGSLITFLATNSMTEGKPGIGDSHIIHSCWDNSGGYDTQLAIGHGTNPNLQIRAQQAGTWGNWITFAHSGNVGTGDSNGQVKIAGTNVSVKGLAAAAYKGVFTRSSVGDIGWGTEANRTKVLEVNAIAFWNGRHSGTSSNLQYCDRGRFGTIVTKATGDYLPIGGGTVTGYTIFKQGIEVNKAYSSGTTTNAGGIELFGGNDAFMDFHRLYSSADFTYRITHRGDDTMDFIGHNSSTWGKLRAAQFAVQSSIHVKENVEDITDEEANKILQLRPISFDYSDKDRSDRKNHRGLIAEEVLEIYPEMVDVPNGYTEFNPEEPWNVPSIDYSNFVPYLIKMCQIQQEQINTLSEKLDNLNKN